MLCPLIGCNTTNLNPKSLNLAKFSFSVCGWGGGVLLRTNSNPKSLNLGKFSFSVGGWVGGGVTLDQPKSEVPQSGQIFIFMGEGLVHPNFHWGGCTLDQLKSKVPHQLKSEVFQSGQIFILGQGTLYTNSNSKSQVLTQFSISGWEGVGVLWTPHSSNTWVGSLKEFCTKNSRNLTCPCIADSPSHTMWVETN